MDIVFVYSRPRMGFRRDISHLKDTDAHIFFEDVKLPGKIGYSRRIVTTNEGDEEEEEADWLELRKISVSTSTGPVLSEHEVNTDQVEVSHSGMIHVEGGWPREVEWAELEQTVRYRRKVEKDEGYLEALRSMADRMDLGLRQNNALDIFEDYFPDTGFHSAEVPWAKTLTVLRDPEAVKRTVCCIDWFPDAGRKVAMAYSSWLFQKQPAGMSFNSYVWDIQNANEPDLALTPPSSLCCIKYNPKEHTQLLGGCYNGLIQFWDTRQGSVPVESSPIEKSHRDPIFDLVWLQGKTMTECASVSTDGQIFWWDTRKLGEPSEALSLDPKGESGQAYGGVSIAYDAAAGPSTFLVGTEQGAILKCKRNAKSKGTSDRILGSYSGHHGPVSALWRHPLFPKYFLSVGDWTARVSWRVV